MTTANDLKRALLDALSGALNAPRIDYQRVNDLCSRLDAISS